MDRGPGRYRCVTYLRAWTHGAQEWADEHVRACDFCRPIAYGDGERFVGTIHDEAQRLRQSRQTQRTRRRAFIGATAAGVIAITAGVLWSGEGETRAKPSNGKPTAPTERSAFSSLDREYRLNGRACLTSRLSSPKEPVVIDTLSWIVDRQHSSEYDLVVTAAGSSNERIKSMAIALLDSLSAADLLPHVPAMQSFEASEADPVFRKQLTRLIDFAQNG